MMKTSEEITKLGTEFYIIPDGTPCTFADVKLIFNDHCAPELLCELFQHVGPIVGYRTKEVNKQSSMPILPSCSGIDVWRIETVTTQTTLSLVVAADASLPSVIGENENILVWAYFRTQRAEDGKELYHGRIYGVLAVGHDIAEQAGASSYCTFTPIANPLNYAAPVA